MTRPDSIQPVWAVVAGRMGSSRLAGKTVADIGGTPSLERIIARLRRVPGLDGTVVATTVEERDEPIRRLVTAMGVPAHAGSERDVLRRTLDAARSVSARTVVQVTGDCPLVDPGVVRAVLEAYERERPDYASNVLDGDSYPVGLAVEVFATDLLAEVEALTDAPDDREHVSLYIYERPERYRLLSVPAPAALTRPGYRLTLDTAEDLEVIRAVYAALEPHDAAFTLADVVAWLDRHPDLVVRNGGSTEA